eukprot:7349488-Lingulodinium_polyedra.AAC.1
MPNSTSQSSPPTRSASGPGDRKSSTSEATTVMTPTGKLKGRTKRRKKSLRALTVRMSGRKSSRAARL